MILLGDKFMRCWFLFTSAPVLISWKNSNFQIIFNSLPLAISIPWYTNVPFGIWIIFACLYYTHSCSLLSGPYHAIHKNQWPLSRIHNSSSGLLGTIFHCSSWQICISSSAVYAVMCCSSTNKIFCNWFVFFYLLLSFIFQPILIDSPSYSQCSNLWDWGPPRNLTMLATLQVIQFPVGVVIATCWLYDCMVSRMNLVTRQAMKAHSLCEN